MSPNTENNGLITKLVYLLLLISYSYPILSNVTLQYAWHELDYEWNNIHTRANYIACASESTCFIPQNNALAGIKIDRNGGIYVTVPRWIEGVPATLNKVVESNSSAGTYILQPYPSWDMQTIGVPGDLQNCQSMVIDRQNRMWAIEVGRRNFFETSVSGPAGLWIIDLSTGNVTSKYYFPNNVASYTSSFVNDIVLDESREIAYLSDANGAGGILVYNFREGTSRRYSGPSTAHDPTYVMIVNGVNYGLNWIDTPTDGIAITDDFEAIFYCSLVGDKLFRLPTAILRDFTTTLTDIDNAVEVLGVKEPSDGMLYWNGILYYGALTESTYYALRITATSTPNIETESVPVWPEQVDYRWPDTFTIDLSDSSRMWFISNSLDLFIANTMNVSDTKGNTNFRILSATATDFSENINGDSCNSDAAPYRTATYVLVAFNVFVGIGAFFIYRVNNSRDLNLLSSDTKPHV